MTHKLAYKILSPTAKAPSKAHDSDAGFDLFADIKESVSIGPLERILIPSGVAIAIPEGFVGLIRPRSGLALKKGYHTLAGVIDAPYRGEIKMLIFNSSSKAFQVIAPGEKIAQILIIPCPIFEAVPVQDFTETDRGSEGFGSSGSI